MFCCCSSGLAGAPEKLLVTIKADLLSCRPGQKRLVEVAGVEVGRILAEPHGTAAVKARRLSVSMLILRTTVADAVLDFLQRGTPRFGDGATTV